MTMVEVFLYSYFAVLFGYLLVLIVLVLVSKKDKSADKYTGHAFISILVAARNEEKNILACLQALSKLNLHISDVEILIGNDQSEDSTEQIVLDFIKDKPHFRIITISDNNITTKGKAKVLATLAKQAKGEFYFITDADIKVPENWIQSLLSNYDSSIGIVSGATKAEGNALFHYCQKLDWIYAFGMVKTVSDCGIPVSAVGNNMMISKEAYWSTGGYEKIPFSITEDLQLFLETLKKGWKYKNLMSPDSLATTAPVEKLSTLLQQRKRWMNGALQLPFVLLLFLFIQALLLPVLILSLIYSPLFFGITWCLKILLQQTFMYLSFRKIGEHNNIIKSTIVFEIYSTLLSILVVVNYILPQKIKWKGRSY